MSEQYRHLGIFSDLVTAAYGQQPLYPIATPGAQTRALIRETLGFCRGDENPQDVKIECEWEKDGVAGQEISWSVGFGPRTHAYLLKPAGAKTPLPGIVALHDHSGFKYYGKEKIADGPGDPESVIREFRKTPYGGRAYTNALAREGFAVLVHDVFLWGSRKFPFETMLDGLPVSTANLLQAYQFQSGLLGEIERYNLASDLHEHVVSKYCNVLGTSMSGVVAFEDRVAVNYLLSRPDVDTARIGCIGLSGGGNRAAMLNAIHDNIRATVIVGLMSTYNELLDHNVSIHTWMLFPFNWSRYGDWSDIAACRAPAPLLVQYDVDDPLFTESGMRAAHARLQNHYASVGQPAAYTGQFYPGTHKFDLEMQSAAFAWLKQQLHSDKV